MKATLCAIEQYTDSRSTQMTVLNVRVLGVALRRAVQNASASKEAKRGLLRAAVRSVDRLLG